MSKIALEGNSLGSGTFTIAAPNSNSNPTLTLPTSSGTLVVTGGAQTIEFAAGTAAAPSITFTGDTNTGIFSPGADTIAFSEGGVEAMRIDSSGNVGIGTSSPLARLDVKPAAENILTGGLRVSTHNNTTQYGVIANDGALQITSVETSVSAPSIRFNTSTNGSTVTERMRIDSSGNVGIGKTPGTSILDIAGEGQTGSNNMYLTWSTTSSGFAPAFNFRKSNGTKASPTAVANGDALGTVLFAGYDGSNYQNAAYIESRVDGTPGANDMPGRLMFFTTADGSASPTERARITSAGRFCINTTYSDTQLNIAYNGSSIRGVDINNTVSSNQDAIYFRTNGTNVGRINTDASNTSYVTSSDYRLKENVLPMTGALEKLAQLKPCTWTWKVNGAAGQGFIAHELQEVCPNAVVGEKDAIEIQRVEISPAVEATYDEDGNELTPTVDAVYEEREVPKYQGVDTSFLVATLTAAIQELKAITDAQATRIEALEAEVAALKGQ